MSSLETNRSDDLIGYGAPESAERGRKVASKMANAPVALVQLGARVEVDDATWSGERWRGFLAQLKEASANVVEETVPDSHGRPRVRFNFADWALRGQAYADRLLVIQSLPYPSWDYLGPRLAAVLSPFWGYVDESARLSCSLEYQNHVHLGAASIVEPQDYFNIYPGTSGALDRPYVAFMSGVVTIAADGASLIRVELVSSSDEERPESLFADLHISYTSAEDANLSKYEAFAWLDSAHEEVERTFLAALTDRARRLMEGVND